MAVSVTYKLGPHPAGSSYYSMPSAEDGAMAVEMFTTRVNAGARVRYFPVYQAKPPAVQH